MGEGQILAQVKQVHKVGQNAPGFGRHLNGLFKQAVTAGKRVRSETSISSGAVSVSSAAAELAQLKLPTHDFNDAKVRWLNGGGGVEDGWNGAAAGRRADGGADGGCATACVAGGRSCMLRSAEQACSSMAAALQRCMCAACRLRAVATSCCRCGRHSVAHGLVPATPFSLFSLHYFSTGLHHRCGQDVQAAGQAHALQGLHAHDRAQPQPAARRGAPRGEQLPQWAVGQAACGRLPIILSVPLLACLTCLHRLPAHLRRLLPRALCRRRWRRSSPRCSLTSTSCTTS